MSLCWILCFSTVLSKRFFHTCWQFCSLLPFDPFYISGASRPWAWVPKPCFIPDCTIEFALTFVSVCIIVLREHIYAVWDHGFNIPAPAIPTPASLQIPSRGHGTCTVAHLCPAYSGPGLLGTLFVVCSKDLGMGDFLESRYFSWR